MATRVEQLVRAFSKKDARSLGLPADGGGSTGASTSEFLAALMLEAAGGDAPGFMHPVRWMKRTIWLLERFAPRSGKRKQLVYGTLLTAAIPAGFTALAGWSRGRAYRAGDDAGTAASAALLKTTFEVRPVMHEAGEVREALEQEKLPEATKSLATLGRRAIDEAPGAARLVAETISALGDRSTDSFVAPWFYYVVAGLPGAFFYRATNTLDVELGRRQGRNGSVGTPANRLNDALSYLPGRLTALLTSIATAAWRCAASPWRRKRRIPSLPYLGQAAEPKDIRNAVYVQYTVAAMAAGLTYAALWLRARFEAGRAP